MFKQGMMQRCTFIASLLVLAACGGGSGSGNDAVVQPPPVAGGDDIPAIVATLSWDTWLAESLLYSDRDGDGVQDDDDTWPDDRPILTNPTSAQSLSITRAWTEFDGNTATDTAVEGYLLNLQVKGLPTHGSESIWVVFQTNEGFRASFATVTGIDTLSVAPYPDALGAHIVAGASRGMNYHVASLRAGQPVLFALESTVMAGTQIVLEGRNLDAVELIRLGGHELQIVDTNSAALTVQLPQAASGNRLVARSSFERSNTLELDLRHDVELRVSRVLELAQQEELRFWSAGTEYRLSQTQPLTLSLPAWTPTVLSFDIADGDSIRSYNRLRAVVWPGDSVAEVSASNSLLGRMLNIRHLLSGISGSDWVNVRSSIERATSTPAAQAYFAALADHVGGRSGPPAEALVSAAIESYGSVVKQASVSAEKLIGGELVAAAAPTTLFGELDEIIGSVVTYIGEGSVDKTTADPETGYYQPPSQIFGNDYSQVTVQRHEDTRNIPPQFLIPGACEYSTGEEAWFLLNAAKVWKSDLCIQIDGLVFMSAAVVKPGFKSAQSIFNQVAQGAKPRELVRRHSRADFLDASYQLGAGGYYLRSDDGEPLCHMETCYIEVITSGYGAYVNVSLSASQQKLVDTLRVRMWVEGLIPWMLGLTGDAGINTLGVQNCVRGDLLKNGGLYTAADQLQAFLAANRNKTGNDLLLAIYDGIDQKIAPWARQYVQGQLGQEFINCVAAVKPADEAINAIKDKLLDVAGLSTFVEVLSFVQNLGSAVLTPEKFVFKMQPRAEITGISPKKIDLYQQNANLTISGDWLANIDSGAADPCSGEGWCPELVFVDRLGGARGTKTFQLDQSHFGVPPNCGLACTELTVPISDLDSLQDLLSGPVSVELAIADPSFTSYPGTKLRIPVPRNVMTLTTKASLHSISPPLAKPGETITVKGHSLSVYGASAIYELKDVNGVVANKALRKIEGGSEPDSAVRLKLPDIVALGQYRIVLKPGSDAMNDGLPALESVSPLVVTAGDLGLIVVGDHGLVKDDAMRVEFLDTNDNIVFYIAQGKADRPIRFDLPTSQTTPEFPLNSYVVPVPWDDSPDASTTSGLANVSEFIGSVRVTCVTPGADGTCTFGLASQRERLCFVGGELGSFAKTGKISQGNDRQYYLAPGATPCGQVVPPP